MLKSGENWGLEYKDGVVVGHFDEGLSREAFEEEIYPAFEEILDVYREEIVATADLVEVAEPFCNNVLGVWEQSARDSAQLPNFERAAIVADRIKQLAVKNQLRVPGIEIETFEDFDEAVEWARHGNS